MAFDGIAINAIVNELNNSILNGKIDKIYQPTKNELLLGIYCNTKNYSLLISITPNNYRLNLTTNIKPNPATPPNFCMLLRKHLLNSKIKKIYTNGLERIVTFEFDSNKKLIIELMGKHSNVILTNSDNMIFDSMRHLFINSNSNRNIFPNTNYLLPENSKKDFLSLQNFDEFFNIALKEDISKSFIGISNYSVTAFCSFLGITDLSTKENLRTYF